MDFCELKLGCTSLTDTDYIIEGCTFDGNAATPSTGADGVRMQFASNIVVRNNKFSNFGDATAFVGSSMTNVSGNSAYNISNTCWDNWWGPTRVKIENNYCETNKHGIQVTGNRLYANIAACRL